MTGPPDTTKLLRESAIRENADQATNQILDLWHELCQKEIGSRIEIGVVDSRGVPRLAHAAANGMEVNTGFLHWHGCPYLLIAIHNAVAGFEPILLTHEIGHWILKLQGFTTFVYDPERDCDREILINSLCHHPAINHLQRQHGQDPQAFLDERAAQNLGHLKADTPYSLMRAMVVADDLMHCSPDLKRRLLETLSRPTHTETKRIAGTVLETATHYELITSDGASRLCRMLLRKFSWGDGWRPVLESVSIRKTVASWNAQAAGST